MNLNQFNVQLNLLVKKVKAFFTFIYNKLKNFKNLTLGEQISYVSIGLGLILVIISVILFIL